MFKIAVLISGGGSNLQSIIDTISTSKAEYEISCVIADRECYGIERAENNHIETKIFDRKILKKDISKKIDEYLGDRVDLVVLAGFLSILDENFINNRRGRIINIHPSLLPKFGGPGMFGIRIHKAVIEAKENESGCTVHYVDAGVDTGEIIEQRKVKVEAEDTAETLQKKVLMEEHKLLPKAISLLVKKLS
ncbi:MULTISPECIES: phosphoribosylglycinamide formyltransferase [Psychrilyobacter]|uniref:Phosphoribosylglycinamide formyltransferase n=1 Tax=Psychrilyobacter piezotolerans TaxID=2293438 RepID=A0ABX9KD36_9FUSO|nr:MULTISPECIES: phosphoribosylglycinamide formyltransferase [Psychrilyobacter]MCS5422655.1 phosphoribosylglycinamide formyltransferase [Psychrilyobacter sp. S5]NDI79188.1 phosphoribosylglycinamide formyltransferase [Psychrilyobacter piezotolerans]RDE58891.1 phosphoribosylglycinamide formyltransferase [Psychrilyobacter sp. S5]REI39401.1 phosphoribosylglycinamide formyltransferase [Psychrilyobacter piezotolerans]